jgi:hypothetical protein
LNGKLSKYEILMKKNRNIIKINNFQSKSGKKESKTNRKGAEIYQF